MIIRRIHLKTQTANRQGLIDFCLNSDAQCLALGWNYGQFSDYADYYQAIKNHYRQDGKRTPHAINAFRDAKVDDLFWTRDLNGVYWICRVTDLVLAHSDNELDIGAIIPVEAYELGLQVPGQIKAAFTRANGGTVQTIYGELVQEYSKSTFNRLAQRDHYAIKKVEGSILDNLPDFELEELVISYLQIKKDYYVLSNSIANKSTTIKIECELMSRNPELPEKAVVQVKAKKGREIDARTYAEYAQKGYHIYFYAPKVTHLEEVESAYQILEQELLTFYEDYKSVLPESITQWENILE